MMQKLIGDKLQTSTGCITDRKEKMQTPYLHCMAKMTDSNTKEVSSWLPFPDWGKTVGKDRGVKGDCRSKWRCKE